MAKTGRNEPCPCGSGLKYKKCCHQREALAAAAEKAPEQQTFVTREIARLQEHAATKQSGLKLIGTLVFFATEQGDAWLLELTEQDALLVARGGQKIPVKILETEDDLEISWTHSFVIKGSQFITTAYLDDKVDTHNNYPVTVIKDAQNKFRRKFSDQQLKRIHRGEQTDKP